MTDKRRFEILGVMLEERRRVLLSELRSDLKHKITGGNIASSETDVVEEAVSLALIEIRTEALHHINSCIERLNHGSYGDCVECGMEIGVSRLQSVPFTVYCVICKEREERVRKRDSARAYGSAPLFGY